ncbi:MAG: hypothetical protein ABMA13_22680 [Chthoniobacteraceae bacterium]
MQRSRAAFTFMELLLAIALAVVVMTLSIPILGSIFGGRELEETFTKFEDFARQAQAKAMKEHRTFLVVWNEEGGLTIEPEIFSADDSEAELPNLPYGGAELKLERPFSLEDKPVAEWPFWRSGACEPVRVSYKGREGRWIAEFDALSARGTIIEMEN